MQKYCWARDAILLLTFYKNKRATVKGDSKVKSVDPETSWPSKLASCFLNSLCEKQTNTATWLSLHLPLPIPLDFCQNDTCIPFMAPLPLQKEREDNGQLPLLHAQIVIQLCNSGLDSIMDFPRCKKAYREEACQICFFKHTNVEELREVEVESRH